MTTLFTGLTCNNASYLHTPLIEICPLADTTQLQAAVDQWYGAEACDLPHYLLFTSRYAVKYWAELARGRQQPLHKTVVSIGTTTTKALTDAGFRFVEQVEKDDSYGVVDWFSRQPRGRVLIPRSNLALPLIPNGLTQQGFEVECVTAYMNQMPEHPQKVDLGEVDKIVFTSPSTIDNFIRLYGGLPTGVEYVTRGAITEKHLQTKI